MVGQAKPPGQGHSLILIRKISWVSGLILVLTSYFTPTAAKANLYLWVQLDMVSKSFFIGIEGKFRHLYVCLLIGLCVFS